MYRSLFKSPNPGALKNEHCNRKTPAKKPQKLLGTLRDSDAEECYIKYTMTKKKGLHPRNLHRHNYPLEELQKLQPALKPHMRRNPKGEWTLDFGNEQAVRALNESLLKKYYGVKRWSLPEDALCPPVPGRADYLHYLADLLAEGGPLLTGQRVRVLDIGAGSNCIYPLIGRQAYDWHFVAVDSAQSALRHMQRLLKQNPHLQGIEIRQQKRQDQIFKGVIHSSEKFALSMCNPPFYRSAQEARAANRRKNRNLKSSHTRNFGGQVHELITPGGEAGFIRQMIQESRDYAQQLLWFSSLVSNHKNLKRLMQAAQHAGAQEIREIQMTQGQKVSRILAWSFFNKTERKSACKALMQN